MSVTPYLYEIAGQVQKTDVEIGIRETLAMKETS